MKGDLVAAGFVVNDEKSTWPPVQEIIWLGIVWDGRSGSIAIKPSRIAKATNIIEKLLASTEVSARQLSAFVGSIISMGAVLGRLARIITRHCQITIAATPSWDETFKMDYYCRKELLFWRKNISFLNSKKCCISVPKYHKIVYSDASKRACGALILGDKEIVSHKMFTEQERELSSTHRELIAISYSLEAFGHLLRDSCVKWFTDNQSTARIVDVGSMKISLHELALEVFSYCFENNIDLNIQWIPRELNSNADAISKIQDCDNWQLSEECFTLLERDWGPHTLDCFASFYNAKVKRFYSRFWNPGTAGVDAFFQPWEGENCLVVPPVSIIPRVLNFMSTFDIQATLVVPHWPSSSFWPLLWQRYAPWITDYQYFQGNRACIHGRNKKSILGSPQWEGQIIALRMLTRKLAIVQVT